MSQGKPAIQMIEVLRAWQWAEADEDPTLSDLGIFPITKWRLTGRCRQSSSHGVSNEYVETTDQIPTQPHISCTHCGRLIGVDEVAFLETVR